MFGAHNTQPPMKIEFGKTAPSFRNTRTQYRSNGDVRAFRNTQILPTCADLQDRTPFLKPNVIDGPYTDVREYLGTQFHLLREDFVAPLRSAVQTFRQLYFAGHDMHRGMLRRIEGVNFYEIAEVQKAKQSNGSSRTGGTVKLSWPDYGTIDWDRSARLKSGCLLAFSKDNFRKVVFAVVSTRQTPALLKKGVLFIEFIGTMERLSTVDKYLMVENSSAYFEAYRHNLEVIKSINPDFFPLQRYLVKAERSVRAPCLLRPGQVLDFEPIMRKTALGSKRSSEWPNREQTILNEQQYKAIKSAFSRELCVIQGPPGTGKTFVALRIVEMLLRNRVSNRPILVVCYTNHALDQFLEGMLPYTEDVVRVGGNSKSEKIKGFTVNEHLAGSIRSKRLKDDLEACLNLLEQLNKEAIMIEDKVHSKIENLEKLLGLTRNSQTSEDGEVKGLRRTMHYVRNRDQDRAKRSAINNYLKGDPAAKSKRSRVRYTPWKPTAKTQARTDLLRRAIPRLTEKIDEIKDAMEKLRESTRSRNRDKKKTDFVLSKRVVGITTTGAAKHNFLLAAAQPEIVIVEEAAEVLESHLLASLTPTTKQLILIGDHQQLQPSTAVHRLAEEFGMEVSLFERLVRNGIDFVKLQVQHRMRDEFLSLLVPHIYENYYSDPQMKGYPNVKGMASNLFFMSHTQREVHDPRTHSFANMFEAGIVVRLAYHFLKNGYKETEITIIATYRAQVEAIEREITEMCEKEGFSEMMDVESFERGPQGGREKVVTRVKKDPSLPVSPFEGMRITTVDDYQGEENKIVIVSFVRSNLEAKIGFLAKTNRVCVALSRAKHGLFCIGDISTLARGSKLWSRILTVLSENSKTGEGLPLLCEAHRKEQRVRTAMGFDEWFKRGCGQTCSESLPCEHRCNKVCHTVDMTHNAEFACDRMCGKIHSCGHICTKLCREACGQCTVLSARLLACGHTITAKCNERILCEVLTEWTPACGHTRIVPCAVLRAENLICGKPMNIKLPCGHFLQTSCDAVAEDYCCKTCGSRNSREKQDPPLVPEI